MAKQIDWNGLEIIDLKNKIQHVLWHDWDPIGINDDNRALGEYDSYVSDIVVILFNSTDITTDLDAYITWVVHNHMGLSEYENFHKSNNIRVIKKILEIWNNFKRANCD
ncbi:MAG: hypothetical protein LBP59_01810 [Planctomycetaceae bacterium]|jgi:hypothetical protein|nr:hypothetical protein [Planctomycetaceae bacterium]